MRPEVASLPPFTQSRQDTLNCCPRIIRLQLPNNQGYYYLSYRQPTGYDDTLSYTYTQGVNVHRYQGSGSYNTAFIKSLTDGTTFSDSAAGIEVTQVSHSPDHVTVNISICTSAAPLVTLSPTNQSVRSGTLSNYIVTVQNQDGLGCPGTTFTLNYAGTPAGTLSSNSLQLSAGGIGSVTLQVSTTGLASSSYPLQVQASDNDGVAPNHATAGIGTVTLNVDDTPPTVPTGLRGSVDSQSHVTLSWNASSDTLSGVQSYTIYRDGLYIGQTSALVYNDVNTVQGNTYQYAIAAIDGVGNVSALSTPANVSTTACSAANPLVTLSPSSQMVKAGVAASYTVQVSNQDGANCPATTFTLSYSGTPSASLTPPTLTLSPGQSSTVTLQAQTSSSGSFTLQVSVADNDGVTPSHATVTTSATLVSDGTTPTTPTGLQATPSPGKVQMNWAASTDTYSGVQGYIVYRNSAKIAETTTPSYTDNSVTKKKRYTYTVAAKDKVGNTSSQSSNVTVTAQ